MSRRKRAILGLLGLILLFVPPTIWFTALPNINPPALPSERKLTGHDGGAQHLAYAPNGRYLVALSRYQYANMWDLDHSHAPATLLPHTLRRLGSAAFSPDGDQLILSGDTESEWLLRWNVSGRGPLPDFMGKNDIHSDEDGFCVHPWLAATTLVYHPDGQTIISGNWGGEIAVWDAASGVIARRWKSSDSAITALALTPSGQTAICAALKEPEIRVWDIREGQAIKVLSGHRGPVLALALASDGDRLLSAGEDGAVRLWSVKDGQSQHVFHRRFNRLLSVALAPDGRLAAFGSDRGNVELRAATGDWPVIRYFRAHDKTINHISFAPDGETFATASDDDSVKIWSVAAIRKATENL